MNKRHYEHTLPNIRGSLSNTYETAGIHKEELESNGNMELLLQGEATEAMPLKICTPILHITMDATLKLTAGTDGKPVMEIYGLSPEAEEATGE